MIIYAYTTTDNKQSLPFSHTITSIFSICQEIEWNKQFWFLIFSVQITVEWPKTEKPLVFFTKTENQMLKNEKSAHRNDHQNRKTEVFCNKNRKTDLKNSQNRKTENLNAPLRKD